MADKGIEDIVQSIIAVGNSLNLQRVAECVQYQMNILAVMGCSGIQDDYFAQPLGATSTAAYLEKHAMVSKVS